MLAVGNASPACLSLCVCTSSRDNLKATAPYMGARRVKQTVLRRLYQGSALQQSAPADTMTGLQTARNMQTMSSAQTVPQATVQQISQWWEKQWHLQQDPAPRSRFNDQQSLQLQQHRHQLRQQQYLSQQQQGQNQLQQQRQQQYQLQQKQGHNQLQQQQQQYQVRQHQAHTQLQQQQRQYHLPQQLQRGQLQKPQVKQHAAEQSEGITHMQPASAGITPRQPATARMEASSKRRRSRPNIVSAAAASPSRAASLRATRNFKAVLAGSRFRKMDSGAELLAQAHTLQSLEHAAAEQVFQQRLRLKSQQAQLGQVVADAGSGAVPSTQTPDSEFSHTQTAQSDQSQLSAPQSESELALARQQRAAAAQQDMMAVALDVVESQLPLWSSKPTLDWSAQQHLSKFRSQAKMSRTSDSSLPILSKFTLEERGEQVEVQPVWLLVHQEHPGGPARLYETVHTVYPEVLEHITTAVEPLCYAEGMTFSKPKFRHGPWKGYLVGAVGDVAASEDDALWPNRLFCDKRVMHNVRNSWDIAKFLAEPTMADMAGHHANLKLIQEDRHYQPRWVGRMLSSRWGKDAAAAYFASRQAVQPLQPAAQPAAQDPPVHVSVRPLKLQHA